MKVEKLILDGDFEENVIIRPGLKSLEYLGLILKQLRSTEEEFI